MPSTQIDIKGTLEWAKVFELNRDHNEWNEDKGGEYKVTVRASRPLTHNTGIKFLLNKPNAPAKKRI